MKFDKLISLSIVTAFIVSFFAPISTTPIHASALGLEANVAISESTIVNKASREILGLSHDMALSQVALMANTTTTDLKSDYYPVMQGFPLPLNRGGAVGDLYFWKKTLGTMAERVGFNNGYSSAPMNFGTIEWLQSVLGVTPDATFVWGLNMGQADYAADAADLAEFLTGNGVTNPNGGTNWAQRRIDLGIANPVKVSFEFGNESDDPTGSNIDTYIQKCREIIAAVRQVNPTIKFTAFAKTSPWSSNLNSGGTNDGSPTGTWRDWHKKILQQLGNDIDHISFHPYYLGHSLSYIDLFINSIRDDIAVWQQSTGNIDPTHKIDIYISEHGIWPLRTTPPDTYENSGYRTHDLEGSLGTAEFITRMFHRPEVSMVTLHAFTSGPWYAINKNSSGALYLSGIAEMMKLMNQALGINVVQSKVTGDYTDINQGDTTLTVNAMTTQTGGLNLVIINRNPSISRDVTFQFEKDYKLVKKTILTGSTPEADTTNVSSPLTVNTTQVNGESRFTQQVIPNQSMVVLYLEKKNIALGKPTIASSVESTSFSDNLAVDGNVSTRWSSVFSDAQWLQVDLGQSYDINEVILNWETAYGKSFQIQASNDGISWTSLYSTTTGTGGIQNLTGLSGNGRFIRMNGTQRGTVYGYSLYEFQVFGKPKNLAVGKATTASSADLNFPANLSVDGNKYTRWSSVFSDPQWLQVDLGAIYNINEVILNWEAAYGKSFQIQASNDGVTWTSLYSTTTGTGGIQDLSGLNGSGRYVRMLGTQRGTIYGYSLYEFQVFGTPRNLALGKPATASSTDSTFPANLSVDGNIYTRWSSVFSDPQWLQVDLGAIYNINEVILNWEAAYGKSFQIQVSNNGSTWTSIYSTTTGTGGNQDLTGLSGSGRYVRMLGTQRGTIYGYSLYEFQVFGTPM